MTKENGELSFRSFVQEMEEYAEIAFPEALIETQLVEKTDESYTGLLIRHEGQTAAPVVNLNELYKEYRSGTGMPELKDKMAGIASIPVPAGINVDEITDFSLARDRLFIRLHHRTAKVPEEILQRWVKADMLMTAHVRIFDEPGKGLGSTPVTGKLLESWGVPEDALWKAALENDRRLNPAVISPLEDFMPGLIPGGGGLYIATNRSQVYGAAKLMDDEVLRQASQMIGGDYLLLPSSVHEVLMVSVKALSWQDAQQMVRDINRSVVEEKDRLSDYVFYYDAGERSLERADLKDAAERDERDRSKREEAKKKKKGKER